MFKSFLPSSVVFLAAAAGSWAAGPVAVSPGGDARFLGVASTCPTFSWTGVDGATGYELVVYAMPASEDGAFGRTAPDPEPGPALRATLPAGALSWTPPSEGCLEPGGEYAWSVRAQGEIDAGEWSESRLFKVDPGAAVAGIAGALERALGSYLDQRGIAFEPDGGLAEALARELTGDSAVVSTAPGPSTRMVTFQGRLVPADELFAAGPVPNAPLLLDEPELTLVELGTGMADYTMLQLENPAHAIDWAWTVSSGTGNMFLTSPLVIDGISFVLDGAFNVRTTVDKLRTVNDATIGSNENQGELDIMDLTVGGLGTTLCIDAAGPSKVGRCTSSIRYKEDVDDLALGLDTVLELRPVSFRWKTDGHEDLGFIAEEVAAVDPLLATWDEVEAAPSVKYRRLTALLARAIQDLNAVVEEQGREIERLKATPAVESGTAR